MSPMDEPMPAEIEAVQKRRRPARRGEGSQLRSEIIEAARRQVTETGDASSLSLRSVARAVGVATTSIYLHFHDIGELMSVVKERLFQQFIEMLTSAAVAAGDDPHARVRAMSLVYVDFGLTHPADYYVMFSPLPASMAQGEQVTQQADEAFDLLREAVADAVATSEDDDVALHLWTALHGIVALRKLGTFPWPPVDEQVDSLLGLLLAPR